MNNQIHDIDQIVVFTLDNLLYALPLDTVIRVIHIVEIRLLPKAPEIICGIINVAGEIIPVINTRKRFGLASREIELNDQLIIADTRKRKIALWVDTVTGIQNIRFDQQINNQASLPFAKYIKGVAKMEGELILIYDLELFLNLEEEEELELALLKESK